VLERVHVTPASRDSRSYADCTNAVEHILREKAARSLVRDLRYPEGQAKAILADALGRYLDERFHLTERRMLGWQ
jgi:hypothetical protein